MNRLMRDLQNPNQIRGRENRLRVDHNRKKIAYQAPNGMKFFIDTKPTASGGEPVVYNEEATLYGPSHRTHTLGGGRVCLATSMRGWDLTQILFQCDSWARGYEIFQETGHFPEDPLQCFNPRARAAAQTNRNNQGIFGWLFS